MIVFTADNVPGKSFEILGLVRGNIVTSKNIGRDMMASVKSVVGGEIKSYTEMTDEARQVAEDRMIEQAQRLGADAILAMRFDSGSIQPGTIEMIAYGTAVKFNSAGANLLSHPAHFSCTCGPSAIALLGCAIMAALFLVVFRRYKARIVWRPACCSTNSLVRDFFSAMTVWRRFAGAVCASLAWAVWAAMS